MAAPVNDDFANAIELTGNDIVSGTTEEATIESGEPSGATRSVWYKFTPTEDGSFYSTEAMFTGVSVDSLTSIPLGSGLTYRVLSSGTTYHIRKSVNSGDGAPFEFTTVFIRLPYPGEEVDIALVLLADTSSSMDATEWNLQKVGYGNAFANSSIIQAIESKTHGKIAICFVYWATGRALSINWMIIDDETSSLLFSSRILNTPRVNTIGGFTNIRGAIDLGNTLLNELDVIADSKVIDISSDGFNNTNLDGTTGGADYTVDVQRDAAIADGIRINSITIGNSMSGAFPTEIYDSLYDYFIGEVIGGDGSFGLTAATFEDFEGVVLEKIQLELSEECASDSFRLQIIGGPPLDGTGYASYLSGGTLRKAESGFSGLSHLNGLAVGILADGEYVGTQIVSGGTIILSSAASVVHVGLPYQSDFQTLNLDLSLRDGSSQPRPMKVSNVTFRLLNTRGGYIGPDENNLYEAFTTANLSSAYYLFAPIGNGVAKLYNVDYRALLGGEYSRGGRIFYRQTEPLPVTISAIVPEVTVSSQGVRR